MAARIALGRINGLSMDRFDEWGDGQIEITATAQRRRARRRGLVEAISEITIIIHGTWASDGTWWRPGGDFFEFARTDLNRADLYDRSDLFMWSGKNRDSKRRQAALALDKWLRGHPARKVNVFAHSHGGNVAMLATHQGIRIDRLVMLSPPVRPDYFASWGNVGQAFNIQASHDPVVAMARGGQWFRLPQVSEKELRAGGHSASHDPGVWRSERVANFVGVPW
jgi:pimeloyl-ACP methyl ester carboxylesterase